MNNLAEYRASIMAKSGRDLLVEALCKANPEWESSYDSLSEACYDLGLEELLDDGPEYGADGEPKELDFNHDAGDSWPVILDWEE